MKVLRADGTPGQPSYSAVTNQTILPGCTSSISDINKIPDGLPVEVLPTGTYHIEGTAEIQGTFRTFIVLWRSQPFEIVR